MTCVWCDFCTCCIKLSLGVVLKHFPCSLWNFFSSFHFTHHVFKASIHCVVEHHIRKRILCSILMYLFRLNAIPIEIFFSSLHAYFMLKYNTRSFSRNRNKLKVAKSVYVPCTVVVTSNSTLKFRHVSLRYHNKIHFHARNHLFPFKFC